MSVEIIKEGIRPPAPRNQTWVFPVRLDGDRLVDWNVGNFDLSLWFKEAVGRYPRHEGGEQEEREDILENWSRVEGTLLQHVEEEVRLPFRMGVDGGQTGSEEWNRAQHISKEELPPLSSAQRSAAKNLRTSEEAYARMIYGQELTAKKLLIKVEMFGRLLERKLREIGSKAIVKNVFLRTLDEKFEIELAVNGRIIPLRIRQELVDDLFEAGSAEAEERLIRILSTTVGVLERQ